MDFGSTDMVPHVAARKRSAALRNFVRPPKKTFATISARTGRSLSSQLLTRDGLQRGCPEMQTLAV